MLDRIEAASPFNLRILRIASISGSLGGGVGALSVFAENLTQNTPTDIPEINNKIRLNASARRFFRLGLIGAVCSSAAFASGAFFSCAKVKNLLHGLIASRSVYSGST
jgi:VanZ family protein